jgi:hypothetical protein
MAGREYQGAGGLRLHLDEPLSPQMAEQVRKGHLVPVADDVAVEPEAPKTQTASERPATNAPVADWRAYAVSLGMSEDEAKTSTKAELTDWAEVADDSKAAGE